MPESLRASLDFLRDLRDNNDKPWFDANRSRYDKARASFESFVTELILEIGTFDDMTGVSAKDCIYRINRDVRFSPNKTPYKTNFGAVIGQGGRKGTGRSYYMQLEPDGKSFLAGGIYMPTPQDLDKVRRKIVAKGAEFRKILNAKDFKQYFGKLEGTALKTAPKGYAKDHPDIELLRHTQFLVSHELSDEKLLSPDLTAHVIAVFKAMKPFEAYLKSALE
ncbi:MAG: DUF2461 domain-containing protein [Anaerolineae bacterium]|nr:DUF2461 domain-containing protein [Anaerolineae bacterium]